MVETVADSDCESCIGRLDSIAFLREGTLEDSEDVSTAAVLEDLPLWTDWIREDSEDTSATGTLDVFPFLIRGELEDEGGRGISDKFRGLVEERGDVGE